MLLVLSIALGLHADDVAARLEQGHLSAAYCKASPTVKVPRIIGLYRQIMPLAAPATSYTTVAFNGGYVGLAGNKDNSGGDQINFSIWGKDAAEVAPADKEHGTIRTRQFTHEGTGWAGRLAYPWKTGQRYQIFVHVRHDRDSTIYSAWFGSVDKGEWLLAGRTRKSGIEFLGSAGGFLEHAGKTNREIPRSTAYGPSWVHDGRRWLPCTQVEASVKDPLNARFFQKDGWVCLELGLGRKSDAGARQVFPMKNLPDQPPRLPEEIQPQ